jgi:hypothetical protein
MGSGKGKLQNELGHVPPIQWDSDFAEFQICILKRYDGLGLMSKAVVGAWPGEVLE